MGYCFLLSLYFEDLAVNYPLDNLAKIHVNIMEILVKEEIEKQLKFYPINLRNYINKVEVATYALNRLPPLYASSTIGKEKQKRIGKQKYKTHINLAVHRALAAIERDPLRKSTPLMSEDYAQYQLAESSLKKLENILKQYGFIFNNQRLSWNNLNTVIKQLFANKINQTNNSEYLNIQDFTYMSNDMNSGFLDITKNP